MRRRGASNPPHRLTPEDIAKGNPSRRGVPIKRYTVAEALEHERAVEQLLSQWASKPQLVAAMREKYGVGAHRCQLLITRVLDRWAREEAENRPRNKQRQVTNVERTIQKLEVMIQAASDPQRQRADPKTLRELLRIKLQYLDHLADLTGTKAARGVDVTMNVNVEQRVVQATMQLSAEQVAEMHEAAMERERMARAFEAMQAALPAHASGSAE